MKISSILLFLSGVVFTIWCLIYFKPRLDAVDSDPMTVSPSGSMVAEWPIFVGIILIFVGSVFFYVATSEKKLK
jgi:uncharacterized membrane protein